FSVARLFMSFILSFGLICSPVLPITPSKAISPARPNAEPNTPPITVQHRRGELIIKFKDGVPQWQRDLVVQTYSQNERRLRGRSAASVLTIKDGMDLSRVIVDLKRLSFLIEYAEPNYLVTRTGRVNRVSWKPKAPKFAQQWALDNTGQNNGVPG